MSTDSAETESTRHEPEPAGRRGGRAARRGRRGPWLLSLALVFLWLVLGGGLGAFSGKLSQVQSNDTSSYLPADAESARATEITSQFSTSRTFPGFVVVESDSALTPAQLSAVQAFATSVPDLEIPVTGHEPAKVGDYLAPGPVTVLPSKDGKAALALVNLDFSSFEETLADGEPPLRGAIEAIREAKTPLTDAGLKVYVAGPAGQVADLITAFAGIDGILLLVALGTVAIILLLVYRSPVIPIMVLSSAMFAFAAAGGTVYFLAKNNVLTLDGQAQGILSILVIGAATDYALLLVSRYREELHRHDDRFDAMKLAWRRAFEPIAASGFTVILGLLCLLISDIGPTRGLGPVGAIGIAGAMLSALTFLPALLVVFGRTTGGEHGRWIFWPRVPHYDHVEPSTVGVWSRVAAMVGRRPRLIWGVTAAILLGLAAFLPTLKADGVSQKDTFLTTVESVTGDDVLAKHFPAGSGSPTLVYGPASKAKQLYETATAVPGVQSGYFTVANPAVATKPNATAEERMPKVVNGQVELQLTLSDPADSPAAYATVHRLRSALDSVSEDALVGGGTATNVDVLDLSQSDQRKIMPLILLVILIVLSVLLRALVAPVIVILANVLSFAATMGAAALMFNHVFDFPGSQPSVILYGFVFLVALGIDYSIFLMTRVREESVHEGTRQGILSGLALTGGVITSAGIVLAATFAALGVLPILFLAQIAFIVAFGVVLDTFVVRSLLVPALSYDIGRRIWAPSALAKGKE